MRVSSAVCLTLVVATSPFGRPAPELRALFAPRDAGSVTYEAYVSSESIETVARRLRTADVRWPDGAWTIERQDPFDAFGSDGRYDRYRLARLFGGTRPRVARGPLMKNGRAVGSITLVSPYPNAEMTALVAGTLTILVDRAKADPLGP